MKCEICGSSNLEINLNIGSDIWENGQEEQHLQICKNCKSIRFLIEVYPFYKAPFCIYGKWLDRRK